MNKHMKARPQEVTELTVVECYGCGWKGPLMDAAKSVYLDNRPGFTIPAAEGGNGKRWRCPDCKELLFYTINDHTRKNIGAEGHQFRDIV